MVLSEGADHPRSRGVYAFRRCSIAARDGSSPLARGLRGGLERDGNVPGIIPARAGFTWRGPALTGPRRDHPRSRGVYYSVGYSQPDRLGSSPLARGLQVGAVGLELQRRIIPARAGFTTVSSRFIPSMADHPRSRGVYSAAAFFASTASGSSPLARGLPSPYDPLKRFVGIIPARAGFTSRSS